MKISGRLCAAIASALVLLMLFALLLFGVGNMAGSRLPDGIYGWLATHWRAGMPDDCRLCPAHLFVVVCEGGNQSHIRGMARVASLKAEYARDPQSWTSANGVDFPCIAKRSFRLANPSGSYGGPYDEADPGFRWELSFQVLREDAGGQLLEVLYMDSRTDIDDALFRYEVAGDTVKPLESHVRTRGHLAVAVLGSMAILVLLVLAWGLYFGVRALRRYMAERRRRPFA